MKKLVAVLAAVIASAALAASADAFSARIERGGAISMPSLGKITFGSSPTIQCSLTLNGTLANSSTIAVSARIGSITSINVGTCTGGWIVALLNLPWPITIHSVPSGLPDNATSLELDIREFEFLIEPFFDLRRCLYGTRAGGILALNDTGINTYTTGLFRMNETIRLSFVSGDEACPAQGTFRGTFGLTAQQSITVS